VDGWVASWGCALQEPDGDDDPSLAGAVLRQTIRISLAGQWARLRLSNEYGRAPLRIAAAAVALPPDDRAGANAIVPASSRAVTFAGAPGVSIPAGGLVTTDPFGLPAAARSNLTVTLRFAAGAPVTGLTTHPGSRTTSHVVPAAERADLGAAEHVVPAAERADLGAAEHADPRAAEHADVHDALLPAAVPVAHWYFLSALEIKPYGATAGGATAPAVAVLLGDSLTDGRGSTTDGNDRWPDQLLDLLPADIGIVNQAAGGNRVLRDGLGIAAIRRFDRDVLGCAGAAWLVVFEGVNDIGMADATVAAQRRIGDELIAAYGQLVDRAHAAGVLVYGATITPFGGHEYDDPAGLREATRRRVNAFIRGGGRFDAVLDFDAAVRDPRHRRRVRDGLHVGDGLHLRPEGYAVLARAVPPRLFARA